MSDAADTESLLDLKDGASRASRATLLMLRFFAAALSAPLPLLLSRAPCRTPAVARIRSRSCVPPPAPARALWFAVLKQTLEGSGALGQVRAKIRAEIFKALEEVRVAASER